MAHQQISGWAISLKYLWQEKIHNPKDLSIAGGIELGFRILYIVAFNSPEYYSVPNKDSSTTTFVEQIGYSLPRRNRPNLL